MISETALLDPAVFHRIRDLVYRASGIALGDEKEALVRARLSKRMRALGIEDYETYLRNVQTDPSGEELVHLLDVISTNVTSFYREPAHFSFLSERVRGWWGRGQRRFRFWSAACSTGEEPYSLAMTALEASEHRPMDLRILATDLSSEVLARAREGVYLSRQVVPIPAPLLHRYFEAEGRGPDRRYRLGPELRQSVVYGRLNLSAPPFPMKGPFDTIFCRNVMIYFDHAVRLRLLGEMVRLLRSGGYLMIGHSESLPAGTAGLRHVRPAVYVKE